MPKVRCRYYTNEGHPIGGGCRLLGIGCDYVHPSEAAWSSARPCKQSTNPYPHPHPPRARNQQDASIEDLAYKSPSPWGGGGVSAGRPAWSSGGVRRAGVGAGTGANTVAVQPKQRTTNDSSGKWGDSSAWADPTPSSFVGGWGGNSPPRGNTTVGGWGGATPERTNTSAWGGAAPEGEFTGWASPPGGGWASPKGGGWASPKGGGWGSAWGTTSSDKDKPAAEPIATSNSGVLGSSIPWDATPSSDKNKSTQAPTFASSSNGGWGDGGGGRWGDAQSVPSSKKPAEKEKDVASDRAGWGGGGWGRGEPTEAVSSTALPPPSTSLKNATSMTPTVQESTSAGSVRQPEPRPDKGKGKATDEDFNAWQVGSSPTRKLANADHSMGMDMDISDAGSSHANEQILSGSHNVDEPDDSSEGLSTNEIVLKKISQAVRLQTKLNEARQLEQQAKQLYDSSKLKDLDDTTSGRQKMKIIRENRHAEVNRLEKALENVIKDLVDLPQVLEPLVAPPKIDPLDDIAEYSQKVSGWMDAIQPHVDCISQGQKSLMEISVRAVAVDERLTEIEERERDNWDQNELKERVQNILDEKRSELVQAFSTSSIQQESVTLSLEQKIDDMMSRLEELRKDLGGVQRRMRDAEERQLKLELENKKLQYSHEDKEKLYKELHRAATATAKEVSDLKQRLNRLIDQPLQPAQSVSPEDLQNNIVNRLKSDILLDMQGVVSTVQNQVSDRLAADQQAVSTQVFGQLRYALGLVAGIDSFVHAQVAPTHSTPSS